MLDLRRGFWCAHSRAHTMIRRLALSLCLAFWIAPAWGAAAVWDNADGYFTLSGSDLIATRDQAPTNTYRTIKTTTSRRGGKLYWEIVVGGYADNQWMAGIVNENGSMAARLGVETVGNQDTLGAGHSTGGGFDGYVYFNDAPTADIWTPTAPVDGDVIGFAVDATNGLLWINKNDGAWNEASAGTQDPATGQGGFPISGLTTGKIFIAVCGQDNGTAQVFTLRASAASLSYTPPSGFTVWDDAVDPQQAYVVGIASGFGSADSITTNTMTTTEARNRVIVFTYSHDVTVTDVTSSCCPGGFTLRKSVGGNATEWWGFAPTPMVGVDFTATLSASGDASVIAVAVHGAFSQALPFFDAEATLPISAGPTSGTGCSLLITTANTNDLMFYACGTKGPLANVVQPTGWNTLANTNYGNSLLLVAARLTGAVQTNLAVNPATSDDHENISIGDAVNGLSGGGIIPTAPMTLHR